ncbi:MAG: 4Fe-4S dicluster domain-containing protein, partial [Myxococcales bacterium]
LCYCRHKAQHLGHACDAPTENCLSIGGGANYVLRRGFARPIERSEALRILDEARERGLVQIADNVQNQPSYICNCCRCCCGQLQAINTYDLHAVNPSAFVPRLSDERCSGCGLCAKACPISALELVPAASGERREARPRLHPDRCIGCGVCASRCARKALRMAPRETRPYVPVNAVERIIRQALERGRLANFVFDEGAGRGSRFLNRVLKAIGDLPPARRALANEQLRSRFIRAALLAVRDPTE